MFRVAKAKAYQYYGGFHTTKKYLNDSISFSNNHFSWCKNIAGSSEQDPSLNITDALFCRREENKDRDRDRDLARERTREMISDGKR